MGYGQYVVCGGCGTGQRRICSTAASDVYMRLVPVGRRCRGCLVATPLGRTAGGGYGRGAWRVQMTRLLRSHPPWEDGWWRIQTRGLAGADDAAAQEPPPLGGRLVADTDAGPGAVSYTYFRAHETARNRVCRLLRYFIHIHSC